ncbi:MAG: TIGR03620 family F420-dependent LLM class oxidoreductase [Chloroflexota bacterium]
MSDLRSGIGPIGLWAHLDTLPAAALRPHVRRVAELGYGALWVPETVGREPFTLLGAVAEAAGGMWLGTSIVGVYGRDAMTGKMGAQTLHELTGGRFVLGLGVSHPHLVQKLRGHAYDKPLSTIRQYVADLHRLPYVGPKLSEGSSAEPPILVAALRERMIGFSAAETDGAFPYLVTPERVAWIRGVLDANAGEGRLRPVLAVTLPCVLSTDATEARAAARGYLAPYLRPINYQVSWEAQGFTADDWAQPGSDRLVDAMVAWGGPDQLRARIAALHAAGADHVAVIPLSASGTTEGLEVMEALAPR